MTARRLDEIQREGGWVDLSGRAKFRLSGADRVRYLNGQVTNDVRKAGPGEALYACVTNLKGRIEGDVFIHAVSSGEALMLDAEPGLRERLAARLERYIVADEVELKDETEEWRLWHAFGPVAAVQSSSGDSAQAVRSTRFGMAGIDIWQRAAEAPVQQPERWLSADEAETFRILQGVPRWPAELDADCFPPEAGLEGRAMDFAKGCYIGQEVLSRIRTTGKMPRHLARWEAASGEVEVAAGDSLFITAEGGQAQRVGTVTSATRHPGFERSVGLAYLKQTAVEADSLLLVGRDTPRIAATVKILRSFSK